MSQNKPSMLWKAQLALLVLLIPFTAMAQYRIEDYRANQYRVPDHKRDLWSVINGVVEARVDNLIAFHSRADQIFSTRSVSPSEKSVPLVASSTDIPPVSFSPARKLTLDQWMESHPITGLLILKGNTILYERYQYDRSAKDRMLGNSMSKSVVGLLVGMALHENAIESLDDVAEKYEPRLKGHPYGQTTVRSLLSMTSGMNYSEARDVSELWRRTAGQSMVSRGIDSVKYITNRTSPQGQKFNYNSVETQVLTLVLMGATGKSLSDYTSEKLWKPMGAESPAFWMTDAAGTEAGFMGFNATLRDWGRLGLLWAQLGVHQDKQIIPASYLSESRAWRPSGYGYHIWLPSKDTGQVAFFGVRGQALYVDPATQLVMVLTAAREQEYSANTPYDKERTAVWNHLLSSLKAP